MERRLEAQGETEGTSDMMVPLPYLGSIISSRNSQANELSAVTPWANISIDLLGGGATALSQRCCWAFKWEVVLEYPLRTSIATISLHSLHSHAPNHLALLVW